MGVVRMYWCGYWVLLQNLRGFHNAKMPGKNRVKASCGVCLQRIVNGKEEAIFCEGKCQQWYHRVCASVPRELFATLTASDAPFYCLTCGLSSLQQEVAELTREICRLQDALSTIPKLREENSVLSREVAELCEIQNCSGRTADAVSTKTSSGKQHASWTKVVRRGNRQMANTTGLRPQARASYLYPPATERPPSSTSGFRTDLCCSCT